MSEVDHRIAVTTWAEERAYHKREMGCAADQLRDAVRGAIAAGMTEVEAAKLAGVTRMTVRAWLGK